MAEVKNHKNSYKINECEGIGTVQIADEVVTVIAGLAATEVDGVDSVTGNITNELVAKLGMKNLSKGVKVEVENGIVTAAISIVLKYGYNIPKVSAQVQERVKSAIENMTGLEVAEVKIAITGVAMPEE